MTPALLVLAKKPRPGRSKTRLCPPLSPAEAAAAAAAMLADTLAAVAATPRTRRVLVLDGDPGPWRPPGFDLVHQRGSSHAERIANAFDDAGGPALLIGMDTPQVTAALLTAAVGSLESRDAVIGLAADGGWWALGLRRPDRRVFEAIPMSAPGTGVRQIERLRALGLDHARLPRLRDVDTFDDALEVAVTMPRSALALVLDRLAAPAGAWS